MSCWSQRTFGDNEARGPVAPLKHLAKEVEEAIAEPHDLTEYADCLILLLDATRRADFDHFDLLKAAHKKMTINQKRKWPKPTDAKPVEHIPLTIAPTP